MSKSKSNWETEELSISEIRENYRSKNADAVHIENPEELSFRELGKKRQKQLRNAEKENVNIPDTDVHTAQNGAKIIVTENQELIEESLDLKDEFEQLHVTKTNTLQNGKERYRIIVKEPEALNRML